MKSRKIAKGALLQAPTSHAAWSEEALTHSPQYPEAIYLYLTLAARDKKKVS